MALGLTRPRDPIADQALSVLDAERGRGEVPMVRLTCRYKRANGAACMYTVQTDESNADFGERLMENHIDQLHPDRQLAPEKETEGISDTRGR